MIVLGEPEINDWCLRHSSFIQRHRVDNLHKLKARQAAHASLVKAHTQWTQLFLVWMVEVIRKTVQHRNTGELELRIIKITLVLRWNDNSYGTPVLHLLIYIWNIQINQESQFSTFSNDWPYMIRHIHYSSFARCKKVKPFANMQNQKQTNKPTNPQTSAWRRNWEKSHSSVTFVENLHV